MPKSMKEKTLSEIEKEISELEEVCQKKKNELELERTKKIDKVCFWLGEYMIQKVSLADSFLKDEAYIKATFTESDLKLIEETIAVKKKNIEDRQKEEAEKAAKKKRRKGRELEVEEGTQEVAEKAGQVTKKEAPKAPEEPKRKRVYLTSEFQDKDHILSAFNSVFGKDRRDSDCWDFDKAKGQWYFWYDGKIDVTPLKKWLPNGAS
jgi:hypothetical protein